MIITDNTGEKTADINYKGMFSDVTFSKTADDMIKSHVTALPCYSHKERNCISFL